MQTSNNHNLPKPFLRYARSTKYDRGPADLSVTQLIDSPRIRMLSEAHKEEITTDLSDQLWALLGTAVHHILSTGVDETDGETAEERLYAEIAGWTLSGAIDLQEEEGVVVLSDYKVTSVGALKRPKPEWEAQLNTYDWLLRQTKQIKAKHLRVVAILRDWKAHELKFKAGYPPIPLQVIEIPVWSRAKQNAYVAERIRIHQAADLMMDMEGKLPPCTPEERWQTEQVFAIYVTGKKRALRLFTNNGEAMALAKVTPGSRIEARRAENIRCQSYCPVAEWCDYAGK